MKKYLVISDLDGTIANIKRRVHFITPPSINCPMCHGNNPKTCSNCISLGWDKFKKDFKSFEDPTLVAQDTLIPMTLAVIHATARFMNAELWIATGRSEKLRRLTTAWLKDNRVNYQKLIMRPQGNNQPDTELKFSWLDNGLIPQDQVLCVFEDRSRVVSMWRNCGIQVYQVADGDF